MLEQVVGQEDGDSVACNLIPSLLKVRPKNQEAPIQILEVKSIITREGEVNQKGD